MSGKTPSPSTPSSHAYLEPCSALAQVDQDGRITLWTSTQVPYIVQCLLASTLGMRENDIRVIKPFVGGGFGGKMELRTWEFCAAFMAKKTGRPVKFTLTREEEFLAGRRRHPMKLHSRVGFKKDGTLVAKDLKIQSGRRGLQRHGAHGHLSCAATSGPCSTAIPATVSWASTSTPTSRRPAPCAASARPSRSTPPRPR